MDAPFRMLLSQRRTLSWFACVRFMMKVSEEEHLENTIPYRYATVVG